MKVWTSEMEWIAEKAEEVRRRARIQILMRPDAGAEYLIALEMQTGKNKGPALRVKAKYGGVKEKDTRRALFVREKFGVAGLNWLFDTVVEHVCPIWGKYVNSLLEEIIPVPQLLMDVWWK